MPPPPPPPPPLQIKEEAPQPAKKKTQKRPSRTCQKRKKSRACPRKCNTIVLQGHKTLRLPRKMDVLKFIGGRRSKCIFSNLKIEKKTKKRGLPAQGAKFERDE